MSEQVGTMVGGNTSNPSRKCRKYIYTLNNPSENDKFSLEQIILRAKISVYQLEQGKNGTPHFQGYLEFENPVSWEKLKREMPRAHIEICKDSKASIAYCQKIEGRIEGPWIKGIRTPPKTIENLRDWQKNVIEIIKTKSDDRSIHWYFDENGGIGKTTLAKYICLNFNALYLSGKAADAKYTVANWLNENPEKNLDVIIFDFVRSNEEYISYEALEAIKNGIFCSTKYECKMVIFDSPHVIVFANFLPDIEKLSKDRWVITTL